MQVQGHSEVNDRRDVWAGESYAVELAVLNGTDTRGDCRYRDENTGEIRVIGENTETQVWHHRGGAGSKARIIVEWSRRMHYEGR